LPYDLIIPRSFTNPDEEFLSGSEIYRRAETLNKYITGLQGLESSTHCKVCRLILREATEKLRDLSGKYVKFESVKYALERQHLTAARQFVDAIGLSGWRRAEAVKVIRKLGREVDEVNSEAEEDKLCEEAGRRLTQLAGVNVNVKFIRHKRGEYTLRELQIEAEE